MRCICVYCGILYNIKEPYDIDDETHGNCDECDRIEKHNIRLKLKSSEKKHGAHQNTQARV